MSLTPTTGAAAPVSHIDLVDWNPPQIAERRALAQQVSHQLGALGFNWESAELRPEPAPWQRLPFFTDLCVSGIPLQPHLSTPYPLAVDETAGVYEAFIEGYIRTHALRHIPPYRWLARELKLNYRAALMNFPLPRPGAVRPDLHMHLVQIAALVAQNHTCDVVEDELTFIVATDAGYSFGIADGVLVSNQQAPRRKVRVRMRVPRGGRLLDWSRGEPVMPELLTQFDVCRAWLRRQKIGRYAEELEQALTLMWWRCGAKFPGNLQKLTDRGASVEALLDACELARNYRDFNDPYTALYDIFVPQFMKSAEFIRLFGQNTLRKPQDLLRVIHRWDAAIDEITPG